MMARIAMHAIMNFFSHRFSVFAIQEIEIELHPDFTLNISQQDNKWQLLLRISEEVRRGAINDL
jgi:hypothetical protein